MTPTGSLAAMLARPIAHRGLHGCGGPGPVENTIAAAHHAIRSGYGIECDIRFARDGTPVVVHDATLARLAGRPAAVADLDAAELGAIPLTGGGSIPSFADLLAAVDGRAALVVEIKAGFDLALIDSVLDLVGGYDGPVALESFDPVVVARCRSAPCPIGLVGPADRSGNDERPPRCDFLSWNIEHLGAPTATLLFEGLPSTTWTVRSPAQASQAAAAGAQIVFEGWRP